MAFPKWATRLLVVLAFVCLLVAYVINRDRITQKVVEWADWYIENPYKGCLVSCAVATVVVGCSGPWSAVALVTGYLLTRSMTQKYTAMLLASVSVSVGTQLGSAVAFPIARYLLRGFVKKNFSSQPIFRALEALIAQEGLKIMILTRLSFVVPYNVSNLVLGASNVSVKDFLVGNLFIYPYVLFFAYNGSTASSVQRAIDGENPYSTGELVILVLSGVLTFAALCYTTVVVKRMIKEEIKVQAEKERGQRQEEHQCLELT